MARGGERTRATSIGLRIAIIHRAGESMESVERHAILAFCKHWQAAGHTIIHLFGPDSFEEADIAMLHVDLSEVPEPYVHLARRYPVSLNTRITNIRKKHISQNLVTCNTPYDGPVIVKTDLNFAGSPERKAESLLRTAKKRRLFQKRKPSSEFRSPEHYRIYPSIKSVPSAYWKDPDLVVERFLPEQEGAFYFLRQSYFLGDRSKSWRLRGNAPIVRAKSFLDDVEIPTPDYVQSYRQAIGLDYGKIDYVQHGDQIHILDVNKTVGHPDAEITNAHLAPAIETLALNLARS